MEEYKGKEINREIECLYKNIIELKQSISHLYDVLRDLLGSCCSSPCDEKDVELDSILGKKLHSYNIDIQGCNNKIVDIIERLLFNSENTKENIIEEK